MENEKVFVAPDYVGAAEESASAVLEAAEAESQDQLGLAFQNPWPHLEDYFVLKSRDRRNANLLYFR